MEELNFSRVTKVLLVGAGGKTGYWYARLLLRDGKDVYAFDQNEKVIYSEELLNHPHFFKVTPDEFANAGILDKVDSVTLSPGVPLTQNIFIKALSSGKMVFSELEYCYHQLSDRHWICVTGTDGKSTTVALIEHALNAFDKKAISCGNYGLSFSRIAFEIQEYSVYKYLIAELSSYQLELCRNLKSEVSLYLNLAPDHLNRYKNLEDYGLAKWNIARALKKDGLLIVNKNLLPENTRLWEKQHPIRTIRGYTKVISVDTLELSSENYRVKDHSIYNKSRDAKIIEVEKLNIQGEHNYTNILFTMETIGFYGCDDPAIFRKALSTFKSLPHRYERIPVLNDDNTYINDSKATTTQAASIAIQNSKTPLFLFMGGKSKGEDFNQIAEVIRKKGAQVFLYGENRFEFQKVFRENQVNICSIQDTLENAFHDALKTQKDQSLREVTYLLSPASTSWDQYSSFEERGKHFQDLVTSIKRN